MVAAGLGANRTLLLRPVHPGDSLTLRLEFTALRESRSRPHLGIATTEHVLYNQHGEQVMGLEAIIMMPRRPMTPEAS